MLALREYQKLAVENLKPGSILCGGVGSGKSRTALAYYFDKICHGNIKYEDREDFLQMFEPTDLYIITTAKKRNSKEWDMECAYFRLSQDKSLCLAGVNVRIDSWNNISKYCNVCGAFFIFDEQRVVGSGKWVKSFLQITKKNKWILLSATPGDTWLDYIPVFVANGYYKNRSEFLLRHVVFNRFCSYPKVDRYLETKRLENLRQNILVDMDYSRTAIAHHCDIYVDHDSVLYNTVVRDRRNPFLNRPIRNASEYCSVLRQIVNTDQSRIQEAERIVKENPRIIIFYNFDYELELLRDLGRRLGIYTAEYNGHKHMDIPKTGEWIYLVQYNAGNEGWNCIETNVILFYSQNYSWRITEQASGRIDRLNTPFQDLWYYHILSKSSIDAAISQCRYKKQIFNEKTFQNS